MLDFVWFVCIITNIILVAGANYVARKAGEQLEEPWYTILCMVFSGPVLYVALFIYAFESVDANN